MSAGLQPGQSVTSLVQRTEMLNINKRLVHNVANNNLASRCNGDQINKLQSASTNCSKTQKSKQNLKRKGESARVNDSSSTLRQKFHRFSSGEGGGPRQEGLIGGSLRVARHRR